MDEKRRGRPTVHKIWGINMAILAGDLLFSKVFEAIARIPTDPKKVVRVLDVISKTSNELCEGQAMDLEFESKDSVNIKEYMKMISGKTGALIDASATIGGIIGTDNEEYIQALSKYGRNIGIAFQVWDDVLDL
ncbi:polyprenyl synthetase family protein, partial [Thermococcus sp. ES12]